MDTLLQDLRFALRSLRGSPLLVAAAVSSVALGVGSSAAIFGAVDTFLFKPLDFEDADRLVAVWSTNSVRGWTATPTSPLDLADWRTESRTTELVGYAGAGVNLTTDDGALRLTGLSVSSGFFEVLGAAPLMGRTFRPEDEDPGGPRVAILSHEIWQQTFGADPGIIGRVLPLDGLPTEVVGVMPPDFVFEQRQDLWLPLRVDPGMGRSARWLRVLGRVRPPETIEGAREELSTLASRLERSYPDTNEGVGVNLVPLQEEWFDEGFRQGSAIASAAVLFVLLIAWANVANLLLARGADREREIALRAAIGAGRGRIVRQLLTESFVLAGVGGLLGVGVGYLGIEGIRSLFPSGLPGLEGLGMDWRMLAFTALATVGSGLAFGLAPALHSTLTDLRDALSEGNRGSGSRGGKVRNGLVMAEVGLSVVLLVSAVLLVKAFVQLRTAPLGFDTREVATMRLTFPETKYPDEAALTAFQRQLVARVAGVPGVEGAATSNTRPMWGNTASIYSIPGEDPPEPGREPAVNVRYVSPGYFDVMGMEMSAGRAFGEGDREDGLPVAIVNETFAARHWEGRSVVGQRIRIWDAEHEIVGVVSDSRDWGPDASPPPLLFAPAAQRVSRSPFLFVRTEQDLAAIADEVREVVRSLDPDQAVYDFATLEQILENELSGSLAMAKVLGSLALIAFLMAVVGVYGVLSYSVARRTREMGIRQSLGAQAGDVRALVVRQGLVLAGVGVVGGVVLSLATTRLLAFFLFGVSPFDLLAFVSVPSTLLLTALAASWLPAVRATRIDPSEALRAD